MSKTMGISVMANAPAPSVKSADTAGSVRPSTARQTSASSRRSQKNFAQTLKTARKSEGIPAEVQDQVKDMAEVAVDGSVSAVVASSPQKGEEVQAEASAPKEKEVSAEPQEKEELPAMKGDGGKKKTADGKVSAVAEEHGEAQQAEPIEESAAQAGDVPVPEPQYHAASLDALLPQDSVAMTQANANQQLMNMLSGTTSMYRVGTVLAAGAARGSQPGQAVQMQGTEALGRENVQPMQPNAGLAQARANGQVQEAAASVAQSTRAQENMVAQAAETEQPQAAAEGTVRLDPAPVREAVMPQESVVTQTARAEQPQAAAEGTFRPNPAQVRETAMPQESVVPQAVAEGTFRPNPAPMQEAAMPQESVVPQAVAEGTFRPNPAPTQEAAMPQESVVRQAAAEGMFRPNPAQVREAAMPQESVVAQTARVEQPQAANSPMAQISAQPQDMAMPRMQQPGQRQAAEVNAPRPNLAQPEENIVSRLQDNPVAQVQVDQPRTSVAQAISPNPQPMRIETQPAGQDVDQASASWRDLFAGANIAVESQAQEQSGLMQQNNPQAQQQNAGGQQNAQPNPAVSEATVLDEESGQMQLPEEAVLDRRPNAADSQEVGRSAQNAQQTSFQQSLQEASPVERADAQQPAQPRTDYDIPRQIVDQARLIRATEDTQMVIRLRPEHLGELTLRVTVTAGGVVNAAFHTDNAMVRGIIENSMVQLKQELEAQGIKVDNVDVYAGLSEDFFANSQQHAGYGRRQQGHARSQRADMASFEEETAAISASGMENAATEGVDYRV